jgi:hypothetical protein
VLGVPDDVGVSGPGVLIEIIETADNPAAYRVQVDVTDQLEQVAFFLDENGLESVLEEVPTAMVAPIEGAGVTARQADGAVFADLRKSAARCRLRRRRLERSRNFRRRAM